MAREDSIYAMRFASQQMLIDKLQQENQELKKQIETLEKTNKQLIYKLDRYDAIVDERDELKKQLEASRRVAKHHLNRELDLENQQKEFIEYLENCINGLKKESMNKLQNTINLGIVDITKEILSKYKEIIGVSNEKV